MTPAKSASWFTRFTKFTAHLTGQPFSFAMAVLIIAAWAITGPLFDFSDTWQLIVNTSTTIITFLMVFIIQNTQNRDTAAMQLKLDELIRATQGAHNALLDLEKIDDEQFERYRRSYEKLAAAARKKLAKGELDTDSPEIKQLGR
jgi:low affinity Fe/Cu permease